MIVIAILGILLAIAIPAYQDYLARARAAEGLNMAAPAKLAVSETTLSSPLQTFPASNASAGYTAATSTYVKSIAVGAAGKITVVTQATGCATDPTFLLTPATGGGKVAWSCTSGSTCAPASCR